VTERASTAAATASGRPADPRGGSLLPGFHRLPLAARRAWLAQAFESDDAGGPLDADGSLAADVADRLVENVVGVHGLPLGLAVNFVINGREKVIPMAVEEPSVVAAACRAARLARAGGGFDADTDPAVMIGQIHLVGVRGIESAIARLEAARPALLATARAMAPSLCRRGHGPHGLEVRRLPEPDADTLVLHLLVDTGNAMGANLVNTLVEGLAPDVERVAGARACLRILSNLADRRRARATVRVPVAALATRSLSGREVAARIAVASRLAAADPYRAATHNKGIMNGVDAVAVATGNDWRAIEAGAHAYASRDGRYRGLSHWEVPASDLIGRVELPLAVSTVGPLATVHPGVRLALRILGATDARDLAAIMAAVGLASNLAALHALVTDGIQKGHMALHARAVAAAGEVSP
jgi:hydroxymethylglutaryl-CoA reductase